MEETEFVVCQGRRIYREPFLEALQRSYDDLVARAAVGPGGCLKPCSLPLPVKGCNLVPTEVAVYLRAGGMWDLQNIRKTCGTRECFSIHHIELRNPEGDWAPAWSRDMLLSLAASHLASMVGLISSAELVELEGRMGRFVQVSPLIIANAKWALRQMEGFHACSPNREVSPTARVSKDPFDQGDR